MDALEHSIRYLASDRAVAGLRADPYWPKWDSPWWHMTLLWERGETALIPERAAAAMTEALRSHYLDFFPLREEEIPPGADPYRDIACHCALGTMFQVLGDRGVAIDDELPWIRPWFLKYRLPDGGLNCDEAAYTKPSPKSSVVSTLPPLEAVLRRTARDFTPEEEDFLDRGAAYLIRHRLVRSSDGTRVIDPDWLRPCFPRFYEYDALRGLRYLVRWAKRRGKRLPLEALSEGIAAVKRRVGPDGLAPQRRSWEGNKTLARDDSGAWRKGLPASSFPLLEETGRPDRPSPHLTREWEEVRAEVENG